MKQETSKLRTLGSLCQNVQMDIKFYGQVEPIEIFRSQKFQLEMGSTTSSTVILFSFYFLLLLSFLPFVLPQSPSVPPPSPFTPLPYPFALPLHPSLSSSSPSTPLSSPFYRTALSSCHSPSPLLVLPQSPPPYRLPPPTHKRISSEYGHHQFRKPQVVVEMALPRPRRLQGSKGQISGKPLEDGARKKEGERIHFKRKKKPQKERVSISLK